MALWTLLHLLAVILWIGGMFFALHCLRPAAMSLAPPVRVPLMLDALGRFFNIVIGAVVVIWVSGLALIGAIGMKGAPIGWHVMILAGVIMTVLFAWIRFMQYPKANRALAAGDVAQAGAMLEAIRKLVIVNLVLGLIAVVAVKVVY